MRRRESDASSKITLIILPGAKGGESRQVSFSYFALKTTAAILCAALFIWIGSLFVAAKFSTDRIAKAFLIKQNEKLHADIHTIKLKFASASEHLRRVQEYAKKIRVLADLNIGEDAPEGMLSIGGPEGTDEEEGFEAELSWESLRAQERRWLEHLSLDDLKENIEQFAQGLELEERSLSELEEYLGERKDLVAATPSIWPTRGWVASGFGYRVSPFTGKRQWHRGVDIATSKGTVIVAPADGVVTFAGLKSGYGKTFVVDHGFGIKTKYGHTSEIYVSPGDFIKRGDVVAKVGSTGRSTGPHLHYEVWVSGVPLDPLDFIIN